ncbi:Lrp/AsnC family transcriptional regulator [Brevibacterium album]|uniref:Lrp/AsnC family transcriptional regulator n=1 Tax=Brevibacterium album TaxID=417948 RepID=UPI00040AE41B|nr:AsnC family transcriptional regulator [Brevibacterium album]
MPRTDTGAGPHALGFTESDLELFDAMQENPRGAWTEIGTRMGVSPTTARRRWRQLNERGAAWIATHLSKASGATLSLIEIECAVGAVPDVCAEVRQQPAAMNVYETNGDVDVLLEVVALDVAQLRAVLHAVAQVPGVARVRSSTGTKVFREASRWRTGALPRRPAHGPEDAAPGDPLRTARMLTALRELERDGRASPARLAKALDVSETHARRYVKALLRQKFLTQRVDMAPGASEWPHILALRMAAPATRLTEIAAAISAQPGTRVCAAVAGGQHNLYAMVWMHHIDEAVEVEARITGAHDVRVLHRSLILHTHKRMGHLIDEHGMEAGLVPWAAPD